MPRQYNVREFKGELDKCYGIVADVDKTLVDGRAAQGAGASFLKSELFRILPHISHFRLGLSNYKEVLRRAKESETAGLEYFMDVLAQAQPCATLDMFKTYTERYMQKHALPGAREFMRYLQRIGTGQNEIPAYVATLGTDVAAHAAWRHFIGVGLMHYLGNSVKYGPDGALQGVEITMKDGGEKKEKTENMIGASGLSLKDCVVIGNDMNDWPTMAAGRLRVASPLADDDIRGRADIWISDYSKFLEQLKAA